MEKLIRWYFPPDQHRMAVWVAWQASGMEPLAFHRNSDRGIGLFDIDPQDIGLDRSEGWLLHNPIRNVAAAYTLWRRSGWASWDVPPLPARPFADPLPLVM
jgi:hypothetical protein